MHKSLSPRDYSSQLSSNAFLSLTFYINSCHSSFLSHVQICPLHFISNTSTQGQKSSLISLIWSNSYRTVSQNTTDLFLVALTWVSFLALCDYFEQFLSPSYTTSLPLHSSLGWVRARTAYSQCQSGSRGWHCLNEAMLPSKCLAQCLIHRSCSIHTYRIHE